MKIMVAYDGTLQAKEALVYGIEKAKAKGGEVVALHVFNSPLFMDYDATPNAQGLARAEAARFIDDAKAIIREKGAGVKASHIPAGLVRMPFIIFFANTFIGAYIWCSLLISAGYVLGHEWGLISAYLKQSLPYFLTVGMVALALYFWLTHRQLTPACVPAKNKDE